jgi:hypothetical protein
MLTTSNIVRITSAAIARFDQVSHESEPRLSCEVRLFIDSLDSWFDPHAEQRSRGSEAIFLCLDRALANIGIDPVEFQVNYFAAY